MTPAPALDLTTSLRGDFGCRPQKLEGEEWGGGGAGWMDGWMDGARIQGATPWDTGQKLQSLTVRASSAASLTHGI